MQTELQNLYELFRSDDDANISLNPNDVVFEK